MPACSPAEAQNYGFNPKKLPGRRLVAFSSSALDSYSPKTEADNRRLWGGPAGVGMFFLVRKYLLREISPEYHFAADAAFLAGLGPDDCRLLDRPLRAAGRIQRHFPQVAPGRSDSAGAGFVSGSHHYFLRAAARRPGPCRNYRSYYKTISAYFLLHFSLTAVLPALGREQHSGAGARGASSPSTRCWWARAQWPATRFGSCAAPAANLGLQLVGFTPLTDVVDEQLAAELPARGSFHQLPALIPALNIEQIIIAIEPNEHRRD